MITNDEISGIMNDFTADEIEERLNTIFNGYLGSDTDDPPDELQQNHYLITSITSVFRKWGTTDK